MSSNPFYGDIYDHKTFKGQSAEVVHLYSTGEGPKVVIKVTSPDHTFTAEIHADMLDASYTKRK
ncbi:hypothetical protein EST92_11715 [Streptomyces sp. TM32]|uniref:hypothetical protein n=1 Tax=Streptomyces sp. TM32 TaxID=1652669 RepID=UPI001011775C|nr:hypothetical protein [Streptomyces sp. TM32]RXS84218.1 hypothetical protein EST92_11715 [Streptomyces sp. TM32]